MWQSKPNDVPLMNGSLVMCNLQSNVWAVMAVAIMEIQWPNGQLIKSMAQLCLPVASAVLREMCHQ